MDRVRSHTGPLWPYLVLIAVPLLGFVLPDLISGRLIITGDNLQQNYPLHVLVGDMLRHGQLPFWNQYIFSGTPLMADFNAGAFYPLTAPVRGPARPGGLDRHRGDSLLGHRHQHVRLPAGAEALDDGVRASPPPPSPSPDPCSARSTTWT